MALTSPCNSEYEYSEDQVRSMDQPQPMTVSYLLSHCPQTTSDHQLLCFLTRLSLPVPSLPTSETLQLPITPCALS